MRILHVVTHLGLGGAERVAELLAAASASRGHQVGLLPIVSTRDRAYRDEMAARLASRGVRVAESAASSTAKIAVLEGAVRLARTVAAQRPDVVHLHTEIPEFAWALASVASRRVRTVPVVRSVHNTVLWGGWGRMGRFAERRLTAARVAAVSVAARKAFLDWRALAAVPLGEAVVIYNGVDAGALPDGPGKPGRPPVLCFAGRFEPQKGIDVLLESVAQFKGSDRSFRVILFGEGSFGSSVAEAAERSDGCILVSPPVADLRERLGSFDAILMPSRFEGLPLLAVEALCAGIPILATRAPGLDEVLPDWYPGRCPPGDPTAFAGVMRAFLLDPEAWRGAAQRARAEARRPLFARGDGRRVRAPVRGSDLVLGGIGTLGAPRCPQACSASSCVSPSVELASPPRPYARIQMAVR